MLTPPLLRWPVRPLLQQPTPSGPCFGDCTARANRRPTHRLESLPIGLCIDIGSYIDIWSYDDDAHEGRWSASALCFARSRSYWARISTRRIMHVRHTTATPAPSTKNGTTIHWSDFRSISPQGQYVLVLLYVVLVYGRLWLFGFPTVESCDENALWQVRTWRDFNHRLINSRFDW